MHVLTDYDNFSQIKYINLSIYDNLQRHQALIALKVMHQIDTLGLNGLLGSNPSQGVSAFFERIKI